MRILMAGTTYPPALNGQSIFTANLAEGLARRGHDVMVVTQSGQGRAYGTQHNGVEIQAMGAVPLRFLHPDVVFSPLSGQVVRRLFSTFRPDVVHIQDHFPISRCVFKVARQGGYQVMGSNHFMPENFTPYLPPVACFKPIFNRVMWWWMLELYGRLDVVCAQSRTASAILRRQGLRVPIYSISCGVDVERFRPDPGVDRRACRQRYGLDPDKTLLLFVGRVDGEKRLDVLLRALRCMERADVQLAIAGRGAAMEELKTLANDLGVGQRVRFTGLVPSADLPALLNSADIFVMPSEAELLSIATLEAMACGRPVLVAHAQALPELVTPGVNGYLFRPGDAADAARYLALLADRPGSWASLGAASLDRARQHSLDNTLCSYEKVYETLLTEELPLPAYPAGRLLPQPVKKQAAKVVAQLRQ